MKILRKLGLVLMEILIGSVVFALLLSVFYSVLMLAKLLIAYPIIFIYTVYTVIGLVISFAVGHIIVTRYEDKRVYEEYRKFYK